MIAGGRVVLHEGDQQFAGRSGAWLAGGIAALILAVCDGSNRKGAAFVAGVGGKTAP